MPSPYLDLPLRSEARARRDAFIARQLCGLRQLGFSADTLAREEQLLRGGAVTADGFAALLAALHPETG